MGHAPLGMPSLRLDDDYSDDFQELLPLWPLAGGVFVGLVQCRDGDNYRGKRPERCASTAGPNTTSWAQTQTQRQRRFMDC